MKRRKPAFLTALLLLIVSSLFYFSPVGKTLEEGYGLALLFKLRGPRQVPGKALIVNVDDPSSHELGLPEKFSLWSRSVHAQLVNRLVQHGAELIVFDIHFVEEKNYADDLVFAEAIRQAGNVILVERLEHTSIPQKDHNVSYAIEMDALVPPIKPLSESALALAPFPLPKIPVRLNHAWLFMDSMGSTPTLPVVAFQALEMRSYDHLVELQQEIMSVNNISAVSSDQASPSPGIVDIMRLQRHLFLENISLRDEIMREIKEKDEIVTEDNSVISLLQMYSGESRLFLDLYGPPESFTTLTYHDILAENERDQEIENVIRGKVVFVGAARRSWSSQKDGFYTVFSQKDGHDISGVELAATVFQNLHENRQISTLNLLKVLLMFTIWSLLVSCFSYYLQPLLAFPFLLTSSVVGMSGAVLLFSRFAILSPVIIPYFFLPSVAFILAAVFKYLSLQRERKHITTALGYYLPDDAVKELAKDLSFIQEGDKMVYGACLMTDIESYTRLSENTDPKVMSQLMKDYYQCLFREVKGMDGQVCNVIGDAMLAIWPGSQASVVLRQKACQTALLIEQGVKKFNLDHQDTPLPTRIGLHSGQLLMGNIGAEDHFEYTPVGDIVNTASRIEGLNKQLGTRILASSETMEGVTDLPRRELGSFLFSGKTQPVRIFELLVEDERVAKMESLYFQAFPEALSFFDEGRWAQAASAFEVCLAIEGEDGPSHFYLKLCERYSLAPPLGEWQGVVSVGK